MSSLWSHEAAKHACDRRTDTRTELRLPRPRWHSCVVR